MILYYKKEVKLMQNKVKVLSKFIKVLEKRHLTRKFVTNVLEYSLIKEEEPLLNARGDNYILSLYLYIRNLQSKTNSLVIYKFINDFLRKEMGKPYGNIRFRNIYLKEYLSIAEDASPLSKFSHALNNPHLQIKDLLATI